MNRAFNAQEQLFFHVCGRGVASRHGGCDCVRLPSRRPCPDDATIAKRATVLGRFAAGILVLFLVVSAVVSVVVNVRYGPVARQHAQVAVSSHIADRVLPVTSAL